MKTRWKTLGALMLAIVFVGPVQADSFSLLDLLEGQSMIAGDKEFSGWQRIYADASDATIDPNLANVMVTSLDDGDMDPGPGLNFNFGNEFSFNGDGTFAYSEFEFGFWVTPLVDDLLIKDVSLITQGAISSNSDSEDGWLVVESVYDDDDAFAALLAELEAEFSYLGADLGGSGLTDAFDAGSADFPGQDSIWVEINIFAWVVNLTDIVNLTSMDLRFSQEAAAVPEPGTLALLGLGLVGLVASRRRRTLKL